MGITEGKELVNGKIFKYSLDHIQTRHILMERMGLYYTPDKHKIRSAKNPRLQMIIDSTDSRFCRKLVVPPISEEDFGIFKENLKDEMKAASVGGGESESFRKEPASCGEGDSDYDDTDDDEYIEGDIDSDTDDNNTNNNNKRWRIGYNTHVDREGVISVGDTDDEYIREGIIKQKIGPNMWVNYIEGDTEIIRSRYESDDEHDEGDIKQKIGPNVWVNYSEGGIHIGDSVDDEYIEGDIKQKMGPNIWINYRKGVTEIGDSDDKYNEGDIKQRAAPGVWVNYSKGDICTGGNDDEYFEGVCDSDWW